MTASMSALMPMNSSCHDIDFKNSFFYPPRADTTRHGHPEDVSFLQEGPHQADRYDTMNSIPHLNLSSPSFTSSSLSSPSQTTSLHVDSLFSECTISDLRLLHYQQHQQHIEQYPHQHRPCSSSQEADYCSENFITNFRNLNSHCGSTNSKSNATPQPKTSYIPGVEFSADCPHDIKDINDNMSYGPEDLDGLIEMFDKDEVYHDTCDIGCYVNDDCADSAVSRSNSRSSVYDNCHQSYAHDQQYDSYGYQSVCVSEETPYIKTENYTTGMAEGVQFAENTYPYYYQRHNMYSCCPEPLDLRIDSKKRVPEDHCLQNYCKDDYGSYSPECASYPYFFPNGNCSVAPYAVKQSLDLHHMSARQGSPISDEGFDEPSIPEEALPRILNIQPFIDSDRDSHSGRSISSSPKEKRRLNGELVPSNEKERRKPGRKPGQVSNVLHLWEFMRDLLHNADGRGIIEWVSRQDGVFRVLNSSEVARLWGEKKKNKKQMTYEKLSRSLRYSRLEGYFAELPKDKNYPKKLCFKFGLKAKNWR